MNYCFECGKEATEDHHVIPKSKGGTKTVPLCGECHNKVHDGGWKRRDNHRELTIEGMKRSKAKGVVMGNTKNLGSAQKLGQAANSNKADEFALSMKPLLDKYREQKLTYKEIADKLNEDKVPTAMAKSRPNSIWHPQTIEKIVSRLVKIKATQTE